MCTAIKIRACLVWATCAVFIHWYGKSGIMWLQLFIHTCLFPWRDRLFRFLFLFFNLAMSKSSGFLVLIVLCKLEHLCWNTENYMYASPIWEKMCFLKLKNSSQSQKKKKKKQNIQLCQSVEITACVYTAIKGGLQLPWSSAPCPPPCTHWEPQSHIVPHSHQRQPGDKVGCENGRG